MQPGARRRPDTPARQHLFGMGQGPGRDFHAPKHTRNFAYPFAFGELRGHCSRAAVAHDLAHPDLPAGLAGDLREMGHAEYLAAFAEFRQAGAHHFGHPAADSGVDFIANHGRRLPGAHRRKLDCQSDSGQFAARGATRQRTRGLAGIERHEKFHPVAPPAPGSAGFAEPHGKRPAFHCQALHAIGYRPDKLLRAEPARFGQAGGACFHFPPQGVAPLKRPRKLLLHRSQVNDLAVSVSQKGHTIVPLRLYIKGRVAKVLLGLAKGKRHYNKKDSIIARDLDIEAQREMKDFR
jgi:hypothetical protein